MRFSVEYPLTSPVLVERVLQMEMLMQSAQMLCQNKGQIIQIVGEPGVGKTRLVSELKRKLSDPGDALACQIAVLEGACFEADRSVSFAALTDLLRRQRSIFLDIRNRPGWTSLSRLVPELGPGTPIRNESSEDKHGFFTDLRSFFIDLSHRQSLLFIFEDIHWADEATLEFMGHLIRNIATEPILFIVTYRDQEVNSTLARFLAELERTRAAAQFNLPRLSKPAVGQMLRLLLRSDRPVRAELLELIYALTDGNPLFIEEVVKTLAASDIGQQFANQDLPAVETLHIPHSVQTAIRDRLDHLGGDARELARVAAVIGRRFDFRLLQSLSGETEARLVSSLHELISAQIIIEESPDIFAFRHALTRQAIYTTLLTRERRRLHLTIGEALETDLGLAQGGPADLAYHFFEAEQWEKAVRYGREAATQAANVFAPHTAILHLTRAITASARLSQTIAPLFRERGHAHEQIGDFESAQADYWCVLEEAQLQGDATDEWHILLALGFLWTSRDFKQAGNYLEQAIALARKIGNPQMLANSLNRVGNWLANLERPREALTYHQEALSLFENLSDANGLAETYDLLAVTNLMAGELRDCVDAYGEAVRRWRALGERKGLSSSLATLSLAGASVMTDACYCPPIELAESLRCGAEAFQIAQEIEWQPGQAGAQMYFGLGMIARGEYGRALESGQKALQLAQDLNHQLWIAGAHMLLGRLYLDLFALEHAEQHLQEALTQARVITTQFMINANSAFLAQVRLLQGKYQDGEALIRAAWESQQAEPAHFSATQRLLLAAQADLSLARGDASLALSQVDDLIASARLPQPSHVIPRLWHLRGRILLALKQDHEAERWLHEGLDAAQEQGAYAQLWRILATVGQYQLRIGNKTDAEQTIAASRSAAQKCAETLTQDSLSESYLRSVETFLPRPAPLTARQATKAAFDGLTDREREIAKLIAQGKGNREIAETLTLSKRTVDAHIGNILSKLGFTARAQVVRWAIEKGLSNMD